MASTTTPPLSPFSAILPEESAPVESRPAAAATAPVWDSDKSSIEEIARPFRTGSNATAANAVQTAIKMVVLERLKALFPSTMNQQTEVMAPMIAEEVFTWACPEAGDFETQCTPDSPARSGYRKLPILHTPTTAAARLETYKTATDVQGHKGNRKFFKRVGAISKATLWQALSLTGNSPDPFLSDTKGRSSGPGGGATTLVSADAVESAERAFTMGVKRLVIAALENQLFQERLRDAKARLDFPGPDALTVAMDMGDFMSGISTEMIKVLNIPLPKGIHGELSPEGSAAFTTVDALFNARLQRLHNALSDRNINPLVIGRMIKSFTTCVPTKGGELVLVDELHLFMGASTLGRPFTRVAGSWGDFFEMIVNVLQVMNIAFPTLFTAAALKAVVASYTVIKQSTQLSEVDAIKACHDKLFCGNMLAFASQFQRVYLDTSHAQKFLPLHMLIGPPGSVASQEPMLESQRALAETQRAIYRAVYEGDTKGGGTHTGIRADYTTAGSGRTGNNTGVTRPEVAKPGAIKCSSCKNQLSQREAAAGTVRDKRRAKGESAVGHAATVDITGVDLDERPGKRQKKTGAKTPKSEPHDNDIEGKAGFLAVNCRGLCTEDFKQSEVKLKAVTSPFENTGSGWSSQTDGTYKKGPGGLCKEDCKQFVFPQHLPKCAHGAACNFRHMTEVTEGGAAWCTDRAASHRTVLGSGMPTLAAYVKSGAFPTL